MNKDKVSVVCAFRIMQSVYGPLVKYFNACKTDGYGDLCVKCLNYISQSKKNCYDCNIDFFINSEYSYTLNNVSKSIIKLHHDYYKKYHDNFFFALARIFELLDKDLHL